MPTQFYIKKGACSGSRNGVALLAVLACVLLLSILIVSYIAFTKLNHQSTAEYGNSVQAQEIAQGGLQDIISDLHQEIVAGSSASTNAATFVVNGTPIYVPTTNYTAVPAREGYSATLWGTDTSTGSFSPSLVRVSRRASSAGGTTYNPPLSTAYYPGTLPINRASAVSTATPSFNGRTISANRWNKTMLLAPYAAIIPAPFTTTSSASPPTGPPDWVYVTRNGSQVLNPTSATISSLLPSANLESTTTTGTASPVVGRYAFVIYDEGALLDANVAGSPSTLINNSTVVASTSPVSTPTSSADPVTGRTLTFADKSYESSADLYQLTGFNMVAGAQAQIDSLIALRNAGGVNGAAAPVAANTYLGAIFQYASYGFTSFTGTTTGGVPTSDAPFLSRQDLINYFAKIDSGINTSGATYSQALPYLGTFSPTVSAPTYAPPFDPSTTPNVTYNSAMASVTPTYHTSMESTGIANRDLANVRFSAAGSVIHYFDNQSGSGTMTPTGTYTVATGDPLLQNRFSLARIAWLSQADPVHGTAPSGNYPAAIQSCFGLQWGTVGTGGIANGGNPCWQYVGSPAGPGGTATPFNGTIETLDQVAAENREPNFFELLKAAILSGSLGQNAGPAAWSNGTGVNPYGGATTAFSFKDFGNYTGGPECLDIYSFDRSTSPTIRSPQRISDIQIIKIGANIIDQYDSDSYPTAIYFQYPDVKGTLYDAANFTSRDSGGTGDISGPSDMVYGEENLPYLQGVYQFSATDTASDASPLEGWWQPELWNPHLKPVAANLTAAQLAGIPSNFKIRAYGTSWVYWIQNYGNPPPSPEPPITGETTPITLDDDFINFTDASPTSSVFYPHPLMLETNNSGLSNVTASTSPDAAFMTPLAGIENYSANEFIGFYMGRDNNYVAETRSPIVDEAQSRAQTTSGVTFVLGWTDQSGGFHPYSYLQQIVGYSYSVLGQEKGDDEHGSASWITSSGVNPGGDAEWHLLLDSRDWRFGDLAGWDWPHVNSTFYPSSGNSQADTAGQGRPITSSFAYSGSAPYYEDSWMANSSNPLAQTGLTATYYADPDGIVRPGDGLYLQANPSGCGAMLFTSAGTQSTAYGDTAATGDGTGNTQHGRRPVILNRPFRSVGELGYTSRDLPFKTLDFFTPASADAGLLDVFSLTDESKMSTNNQLVSVVAGQVDLSNAPLHVLDALIVGGSKKELDPTYNFLGNSTDGQAMAQYISNSLQASPGQNPLLNRAALVTQVQNSLQNISAGTINDPARHFGSTKYDEFDKSYLEAPVRALADVTNTRTWNLMVDIIAQSGEMSPTAQSLNDFVVQGEKRYWLHIAIDRYTGKIVAQQLEPVYE